VNASEGLHTVPLLRPDEIALQFSRESGASLLLIKGRRPVWCLRINYDTSPWFSGLFTPLADYRKDSEKGLVPWALWQRPPDPFRAPANAFNALVRECGMD
jgi:hypothetical protein